MGHLTIGASDTVTSQFLLPYLDRFHRQYRPFISKIISGRATKFWACCGPARWTSPLPAPPGGGVSENLPCLATHSIFVAGAGCLRLRPCIHPGGRNRPVPADSAGRKASSPAVSGKILPAERAAPERRSRALGARACWWTLAAIGFRRGRRQRSLSAGSWKAAACGSCVTDIPPQRGPVRAAGRADVCGPALQRFCPREACTGADPRHM